MLLAVILHDNLPVCVCSRTIVSLTCLLPTSRYFSPFSSVDMRRMAVDFGCTVQELEAELTDLIASDRVQARIDADKQILYARQVR